MKERSSAIGLSLDELLELIDDQRPQLGTHRIRKSAAGVIRWVCPRAGPAGTIRPRRTGTDRTGRPRSGPGPGPGHDSWSAWQVRGPRVGGNLSGRSLPGDQAAEVAERNARVGVVGGPGPVDQVPRFEV